MPRYLFILLFLLLSFAATAQVGESSLAGSGGQDSTHHSPYHSGFYASLGLGWGNSWFIYNGLQAPGNGVWFHYTMGGYFLNAGKMMDHYHMFTVRLGYTALTAKTHSNDLPAKYNFN